MPRFLLLTRCNYNDLESPIFESLLLFEASSTDGVDNSERIFLFHRISLKIYNKRIMLHLFNKQLMSCKSKCVDREERLLLKCQITTRKQT